MEGFSVSEVVTLKWFAGYGTARRRLSSISMLLFCVGLSREPKASGPYEFFHVSSPVGAELIKR